MRHNLLPLCCVFLVACWQAAPLPLAGTPQSDVAQDMADADAGTDTAAPSADADTATALADAWTAADSATADGVASGDVADVAPVPDAQPDLLADGSVADASGLEVASEPDNGATGATDVVGADGGTGDVAIQPDTGPDCPMGNIGGGGMVPKILCNDTECCYSGSTLGPCGWHGCCGTPGSSEANSIGVCPDPLPPAQPPFLSMAPCPFLYDKYLKNGWPPSCKAECWCE